MEIKEKFLVILRHGDEDFEGAMFAFVFANSALSRGLNTTVFLVGQGVRWAAKEEASDKMDLETPFGKLNDSITNFLKNGGHIIACQICINVCINSGVKNLNSLREGIEPTNFGADFGPMVDLIRSSDCITF